MDTKHKGRKESESIIPMRSTNENEPLRSKDKGTLSEVRFPSCRHVLVFMGFLGYVLLYCLRVGLSVALVAMVNHTQSQSYANVPRNYSENNSDDICEPPESTGETELGKEDTGDGEFNWDSHAQGTVLAAFFYGYLTTQV